MKLLFHQPVCALSILLVLLLLSFSPCAQTVDVRIHLFNDKKEGVAFASVRLTEKKDSSQIGSGVADSSGIVFFTLRPRVTYLLRASATNYHELEKEIVPDAEHDDFSFTFKRDGKTLSEVVVSSKSPLMRQEDDKTIIDPEPIAAASTSAYEILEKTPGVFVDQDGNVYLSSMTPATIYLNGRELKMSTADVATLLKNLPPNAIAKIEVLRTPSAKYDASGTGGIVNIVLRKGVRPGRTGSITSGVQQGVLGNRLLSFNLNNNDDKKSSAINISYGHRNNFDQIITNRVIGPDSLLAQIAYTTYPGNTYFGSYGISNEWKNNWDVNFEGSTSYNNFDNKTDNKSSIKRIAIPDTIADNLNRVRNIGHTLNIRGGLTFTKKIDTSGSQWDNDFFYNFSDNTTKQDYFTQFDLPISLLTAGYGNGDGKRNLITITSDLKLKMVRRFTFETGVKSAFQDFQNIAKYFNTDAGIVVDVGRTNTFKYNELINAAYVQGSKTLAKNLIVKAGLRVENTNMDGHQEVPFDTTFAIHRADLFPYLYVSKKVIRIAGYDLRAYLIYRRTITRPAYDQLNPFPRYVDQYVSEVGNPALRPQFTTNYEANISANEHPLLAIGYNSTKDIFTNVIYQADTNRSVTYRTYDNLGQNKEVYLRGLGAIPPGGRYFFVVGGQFNHNLYNGLYEGNPLLFEKDSWTFFTYHQLKLDKRSQLTFNGFVRFRGLQQFYELGTFGSLNTSINRQFLKQKLTITLSMNDLLYTNQNNFSINQGSIHATGNRRTDTRRGGLNVRYSFGVKKKEEKSDMFNVETPEKN